MRTYLPKLIFILDQACIYIGKYRSKILKVIGDENAEALDNIIAACEAFHVIAAPFLPVPR